MGAVSVAGGRSAPPPSALNMCGGATAKWCGHWHGRCTLQTRIARAARAHGAPQADAASPSLQVGLPLGDSAVIVRQHHSWVAVEWDQALFLDTDAMVATVELGRNDSTCYQGNTWSELVAGWGQGGAFELEQFVRLKALFQAMAPRGLRNRLSSDFGQGLFDFIVSSSPQELQDSFV
jgi:hypothetical protein